MRYILSVSQLNKYVKEIISKDLVMSNLWMRGEISNFKFHSSGHMYFTLKDENSIIKCVMFRNSNIYLKFKPNNGNNVLIRGFVSVFERDGQYQLYVEEMLQDGTGDIHLAYEKLKSKLQQEGLFDSIHKRKLPMLPKSVAVITSKTGSVIRDIMNVLYRRMENIHLRIYPVSVQGALATADIINAIKRINEFKFADVIILARGGGSIEELSAFNDEALAREIFMSRIPIVSAVGHETDFTIADFVADVRAPTPSAAAEIVVPEKKLLLQRLNVLSIRLKQGLYNVSSEKRLRYERLIGRRCFILPFERVYQERMKLNSLEKSMYECMTKKVESESQKLYLNVARLEALSPLSILKRGYSVARLVPQRKLLRSVNEVAVGDEVELGLVDGKLNCKIIEIKGE